MVAWKSNRNFNYVEVRIFVPTGAPFLKLDPFQAGQHLSPSEAADRQECTVREHRIGTVSESWGRLAQLVEQLTLR